MEVWKYFVGSLCRELKSCGKFGSLFEWVYCSLGYVYNFVEEMVMNLLRCVLLCIWLSFKKSLIFLGWLRCIDLLLF